MITNEIIIAKHRNTIKLLNGSLEVANTLCSNLQLQLLASELEVFELKQQLLTTLKFYTEK